MSSTTTARPAPNDGDIHDGIGARVLVLGLGNDVLSDDAIGLLVARRVGTLTEGVNRIAVRESMEMGLALLDEIVGYEHLLLVDAIVTGQAAVGHVHEFDRDRLPTLHTGAPHFVGVTETIALGRVLGLAMPRDVRIFAIEVADPFTIGTALSPAVAAAIEPAATRIALAARDSLRQPTSCQPPRFRAPG